MGCVKYVVVSWAAGGGGSGVEDSLACSNCSVEGRSGEGFGRLPWPTVPKARGLGLMAGQRGANQGPITLSSARPGLTGDSLSEAGRKMNLQESVRFRGPRSVALYIYICVSYDKCGS